MKRTKTFTVEYNYFRPGVKITPTSSRCSLDYGEVYTVIRCIEPKFAGDECVVFVKGRDQGVSTEYFRNVLIKEEK